MTKEEIMAMRVGVDLNNLVCKEVFDNKTFGSVKPYSTDLLAAWQVTEIMKELDFLLFLEPICDAHFSLVGFIHRFKGIKYQVRWEWLADKRYPNVEAMDFPEAICKAALLARLAI